LVTRVFDRRNTQCGIFLDTGKMGRIAREGYVPDPTDNELLLLSAAKARLSRTGGFTIYLPDGDVLEPFEDEYVQSDQGRWRMISVLMVRKFGPYHSRVALGILHEKFVHSQTPVQKSIRLI
jgi:hypothetical protein